MQKLNKSWRRRKQDRPGEILDAAMKVFGEKGFTASRMEDIAHRAGVTKGTIYLYFPSKEEIFKTLVRKHIGTILADVAEKAAVYEGPIREFLTMYYGIVSEVLREGKRIVLPKIIFAESGNFPELALFYREEVVDRLIQMISGLIERAMAKGELRRMPIIDVTRLVVAPVVLSFIWRTTFANADNEDIDYRSFFATHIEILLHGLTLKDKKP